MILPPGMHLDEHYRVHRLVGGTERCRIYLCDSTADGPGRVALKVARHDHARSLEDVLDGRRAIEREFETLVWLHRRGTSAIPQPFDCLKRYTVGEHARRLVLPHPQERLQEPYLLREFVNGRSLLHLVADGGLDDEKALQIALRLVLFARSVASVGLRMRQWRPQGFVVDAVGENVSVVDLGPCEVAGPAAVGAPEPLAPGDLRTDDRVPVPPGLARLVVTLLGCAPAPRWASDSADAERWRRLLEQRGVLPELHEPLVGALVADAHAPSLPAFERLLRAALGAEPVRVREASAAHPACAGPARTDRPVLLAGRYRAERLLATGGRGEVHVALDTRTGVEVAVKRNAYRYDSGRDFLRELPQRRAELAHEFRILRQFASRTNMLPQPIALVHTEGHGTWFELAPEQAPGEPHLVMKRISGVPLLDLLPEPRLGERGARHPGNRLPVRFVLRLMAQLADLLHSFHHAGYLFQDLKPENILADPASGNLFLVDFASVCPWSRDEGMDPDSIAFGAQTHGFAAPEFQERWHRVDERFDVYALGATAYHLLTGVNPERLALERSEEYPTLPHGPLEALPACVRDLVQGCLAPVETRLPTAAAVREAATRARLAISTGRPMDVLDAEVDHTRAGPVLRWRLPPDPRVTGIHIRAEDAPAAAGHAGEAPNIHTLRDLPADATSCVLPELRGRGARLVVATALQRGGHLHRARGRAVDVSATPGPGRFAVERDFAAHRITIARVPPCDGLALRVHRDAAALAAGHGEEIALPPPQDGEIVLHRPAPPGTPLWYALVALHGSRRSAPLFATATALEELPDLGPFTATQDAHGLRLAWVNPHPGAMVECRGEGAERPTVLWPEAGCAFVRHDALAPGSRATYRLRVQVDGVTSAVRAQHTVRRWPTPPPLRADTGVATVCVRATETPDPRFTGLALDVDGARVETFAPTEEARIPLPAGKPVALTAQWHVDGRAEGPTSSWTVCAACPVALPTIEAASLLRPVRLAVRLPDAWRHWTARPALVIRADDRELELGEPDHGTVSCEDPGALAGCRVTWQAELRFPDGSRLRSASVQGLVREQLPPPALVPRRGACGLEAAGAPADSLLEVEVSPAADGLPADRAPRTERVEARCLPLEIPWPEGHRFTVRWRLRVGEVEMPWSEPTAGRALAAPAPVIDARAEATPRGARLSWTHPRPRGTHFTVHRESAGSRVLVYEGEQPTAWDVQGGAASSWAIAAHCDGLTGPVVRVSRCGDSSSVTMPVPATTAVSALRRADGRALPSAPASSSSEAGLSFLAVDGGVPVLQCHRVWPDCRVLLRLTPLPEEAAARACWPEGLAAGWARSGVLRLGLPSDAPRVYVYAARSRSGPWVLLGVAERAEAVVVRAHRTDAEVVLRAAVPIPWAGQKLTCAEGHGGLVSREVLAAAGARAIVPLPGSSRPVAWALHGGEVSALVLPAEAVARLGVGRAIWLDGALGWMWAALTEAARRMRTPLLSARGGAVTTGELLIGGKPVGLRVWLAGLSASGRATGRVEVEARHVAWDGRWTVPCVGHPDAWALHLPAFVARLEAVLRDRSRVSGGAAAG